MLNVLGLSERDRLRFGKRDWLKFGKRSDFGDESI